MKNLNNLSKKSAILLGLAFLLSACGSPKGYFDSVIKEQGYIPYSTPLGLAGVGTIVKGNPEALHVAAEPHRCFQDFTEDFRPTHLRWVTATDLPSTYEDVNIGFGADLSQILVMGNPLVSLNLGFEYAKNVNIKFEGATIEYLDEVMFRDYYLNKMSATCKQFLNSYPFITQALRIEKMTFTFFTKQGVAIELSPGMLGQIMNIGFGVNWSISKNYSLVIETPKYIGYHVGIMGQDTFDGFIVGQAHRVKNGKFDFEDVSPTLNPLKMLALQADTHPAEPFSMVGLR